MAKMTEEVMKLRVLTWNIGGGKLLTYGADPSLIASYGEDGIKEIATIIKNSNADIVALQEAQQKDEQNQIEEIATLAGYHHFFYDATSDSHIDNGHKLGHGILSKYPISKHHFGSFENPQIRIKWEDGSIATSFDKGYSSCQVDFGNRIISVTTLHLIPFRRFEIPLDSERAKKILSNVSSSLVVNNESAIVMGDFNIDDIQVATYLPDLFTNYTLDEVVIDEPTTPKGRKYDHVLFKGMRYSSKVIKNSVLTDHYPVICDFEIV